MFDAYLKRGARLTCVLIGMFIFMTQAASAGDQGSQLRDLRKEVEELRSEFHRVIAEKEKKIQDLEGQIQALQSKTSTTTPEQKTPSSVALDRALSSLEPSQQQKAKEDLFSRQVGGATVRLIERPIFGGILRL